jgi:hypothetical protein
MGGGLFLHVHGCRCLCRLGLPTGSQHLLTAHLSPSLAVACPTAPTARCSTKALAVVQPQEGVKLVADAISRWDAAWPGLAHTLIYYGRAACLRLGLGPLASIVCAPACLPACLVQDVPAPPATCLSPAPPTCTAAQV